MTYRHLHSSVEDMTSGIRKTHCIKCDKERATSRCTGCLQDFCYNHFIDHHRDLNEQLDEMQVNYGLFRQALNIQMSRTNNDVLIRQIDQWELDSIKLIQQTANECRQSLFQHPSNTIQQIQLNLVQLNDQMDAMRQDNDYNEMDINQLKEKLGQFKEKLHQSVQELDRSSIITIQQNTTPLVYKIFVTVTSQQPIVAALNINTNTKWKQDGIIIAGGNGKGCLLNQLFSPRGIYLDDEERSIYIADYENHRIVKWKYNAMNGQVFAGGRGEGNRSDQLNKPTDLIFDKKNDSFIICDRGNNRVVRWFRRNDIGQQVIIPNMYCSRLTIDNNGSLYVSDWEKHEVRRWRQGEAIDTIVAGGNGKGEHLNQLNSPSYIFVDQDRSLYVSDYHNNRVVKWIEGAKKGVVVAGGQGQGDGRSQLDHPQGLIVDHVGNLYIADSWNHRVVRWSPGAKKGVIVVGGNGKGDASDQFQYPVGLAFDRDVSNQTTIDIINQLGICSGILAIVETAYPLTYRFGHHPIGMICLVCLNCGILIAEVIFTIIHFQISYMTFILMNLMAFLITTIIYLQYKKQVKSQGPLQDNRHIQCYSCGDCPEPFFFIHAQTTITPPDAGQCMKTVVNRPTTNRLLVSKGFTRNCIPEYSSTVRVYCCSYDLCNRSNGLFPSILVLTAVFFYQNIFHFFLMK
ncbi:unnamed protein product [Adineta steineri]|uniref:Uncharacterized protein n=1 Tax=Adineta steineri TaxID=433720 RepID=A0A819LY71_9BILA|nr:unnamed protein product [Adineta steineri]